MNEKQLILLSTQNDNERLKMGLLDSQREGARGGLESKKKELENFINHINQIEGKNKNKCESGILKLEEFYDLLVDCDNDRAGVREMKTKIATVKSELSENGMGIKDVREVSNICEELAKLKVRSEEKQQKYEALIEFSAK